MDQVRAQQSDRSFRRDVQNVHLQIIELAGEDPLKQVQLADAVWKRFVGAKDRLLAEEVPMARIILQSLQDFFALLQEKHRGRYPHLVRSAFQGVCAAVMTAIPRGKRKVLAETLGVSDKALKDAQVKLELYRAGDTSGFIDQRGAKRSDTMPVAWIDNAKEVWDANTVESPMKKDHIRNPFTRADKHKYAVRYLEMRYYEMHTLVFNDGKLKFGDDFHWSYKMTMSCKPFYVKWAQRNVCMCIYHLRFDMFVQALYYFRKTNREAKICTCNFANILNPSEFRKTLICPRAEGQEFDAKKCVHEQCFMCKDFKLFQTCQCIEKTQRRSIKIKFEHCQ